MSKVDGEESGPKPIPPLANEKRITLDWNVLSGPLPDEETEPAKDGWNYTGTPGEGDARKLVTLVQDGMTWVGIRAWNHQHQYWMNNNEPERSQVKAWRDLYEPAQGYWERGTFYLR